MKTKQQLSPATRRRLIREYIELAKEHDFSEVDEDGKELSLEHSAKYRIGQLEYKARDEDMSSNDLSWVYCEPGEATLHYLGDVYEHDIPPDIFLVGMVGQKVFFQKFVSHPFYQWGNRRGRV